MSFTTRIFVLTAAIIAAMGAVACVPSDSDDNNASNPGQFSALPLEERAPCTTETINPADQAVRSRFVAEFDESGRIDTQEFSAEPDYADEYDEFRATHEYDSSGRQSRVVRVFDDLSSPVRVREVEYVDDTDRKSVVTELWGESETDLEVVQTTTFDYQDGKLVRAVRSGNSLIFSRGDVFLYEYDEDGLLTRGVRQTVGGETLAQVDYVYDVDGRVRARRWSYSAGDHGPSEELFGRDELGRTIRYDYFRDATLSFYSLSDYSCHDSQ